MWTFVLVWVVVSAIAAVPAFGADLANAFAVATYTGLGVALIVLFGQIVVSRHSDDEESGTSSTPGNVAVHR